MNFNNNLFYLLINKTVCAFSYESVLSNFNTRVLILVIIKIKRFNKVKIK